MCNYLSYFLLCIEKFPFKKKRTRFCYLSSKYMYHVKIKLRLQQVILGHVECYDYIDANVIR